VQYIPDLAENAGTIEDAVNVLYYRGCDKIYQRTAKVKKNENLDRGDLLPKPGMKPVPKMSSPARVEEVMSQGLEKFEVAKRVHRAHEKCLQEHSHARNSVKSKEMDLALVQSKAFRYMVLEKPEYEPTGFVEGSSWRPSFFPRSVVPDELKLKIKAHKILRDKIHVPEAVIISRPIVGVDAFSRFKGDPT